MSMSWRPMVQSRSRGRLIQSPYMLTALYGKLVNHLQNTGPILQGPILKLGPGKARTTLKGVSPRLRAVYCRNLIKKPLVPYRALSSSILGIQNQGFLDQVST